MESRRASLGEAPDPHLSIPEYDVVPLAIDGVVYDLNNRGAAAGHRVLADGSMMAVALNAGDIVDLGTLGGSASSARGMNDAGVIVGGSLTADDVSYHAFVSDGNAMRDLNQRIPADSGWELIQAFSINNLGEITALGHRDGIDQVVVLKPRAHKTEPAPLAIKSTKEDL